MEKTIEIIKACRNKWLSMLTDFTKEELNYIPAGFNNNLIWQLGHVIVSQQLLCYRLSGNAFLIDEGLIDLYKNGSKPEKEVTEHEISNLKAYLINTINQLEFDMQQAKFNNFTPYTISTYPGLVLQNINDVVQFIVSHDALHYGCSLTLKKLVK